MKPAVTDSLLLSGSKEGDMLTAPFKSCRRRNLRLRGELSSEQFVTEPSCIDPKVAAVGDSSQMCLLTERVCLVSFSSGTSCFDDR